MKSLLYAASLTFLAACLAGCKPEEPAKKALEGLSFEVTELELNVGDVYSLEAIVSPSDAEGYTLQWESSDEAVASVSDDGEVTAVSAGTADITVSSGEISATCVVTVKEPVVKVEKVIIEPSETDVRIGETVSLSVRVEPENAEYETVNWTSSDEDIATVDAEGVVSGIAIGSAVIKAEISGQKAACNVSVTGIPVESVSLDVQQLELNIGETYTLQATVLPENATDKGIKWSSDDSEIATVDENGLVTAVSLGETVITVITDDGSKTASCMLTVSQKINGHEYVDLGLGVKWATCNVGAEKPSDYGDYYAWGEIETKDEYSPDNCSTTGKEIGDFSGNPEYDVAAAKWGGTWRMPTADEFTELINNCTMESAEQDGVLGVKVTGPNGNSIFLPLGGSWVRFIPPSYDFAGYYWSSSPYGDNLERATYMFVQDFGSITFYNLRHIGINVRPVSD